MGLDQVRELTKNTQQKIIKNRPFHSLNDFLTRVDPRPVEAENLIRAGGLTGFGTIPDLLSSLKDIHWSSGQLPLFETNQPSQQDWSLQERVQAQKQILGIAIDAHPLELVLTKIKDKDIQTTNEILEKSGQKVRLVGTKLTWPRSFTSERGLMAFLTLEDLEGMVDVIIPPHVLRQIRKSIYESVPLFVEGSVETSSERMDPVIRADKITPIFLE
jgi:DNA polymerase III alpha subunit